MAMLDLIFKRRKPLFAHGENMLGKNDLVINQRKAKCKSSLPINIFRGLFWNPMTMRIPTGETNL
jgi:hypothetical protein